MGSITAEEASSDGLTTRQRLEKHRDQAECMGCHVRIDPLGFALENYDTLGRYRETYSDGLAVDATGELASGEQISGFAGLKAYLSTQDEAFRRTLATKLVAYALGRAETVQDVELIESIVLQLEANPRISTAIKTLVSSPQFRMKRADDPND